MDVHPIDALAMQDSAGPARLSRRRLLQLVAGTGASLVLPGALAGCRSGQGPLLVSARGQLPAAWLQRLPRPWQQRSLEGPAAVVQAIGSGSRSPAALAALSDGWASALAPSQLQPFNAPALLQRLAAAAAPVSRLYGPEGTAPLAFPWAFSPWVIVLRQRPDLARRRAEGWQLLADPSLRGQLVLPASPRVAIELVGGDFERLQQLRRQALAYDDRHALNLLLSGEARAAVVPLQRVIPLLRRDQRLQVVLPASGAPLSWQLLLRPAQPGSSSPATSAPLPLDWLAACLEPPLLPRLLAGGWVPPLPRAELEPALKALPAAVAQLLLPDDPVLQRCWSLPPLSAPRRLALQTLWDAAAPA